MKIVNWKQLTECEKQQILSRPTTIENENIKNATQKIINQVQLEGDNALIALTEKYDGASLKQLQISAEELSAASKLVTSEAMQAIKFAKSQIETYHQFQIPLIQTVKTCDGVFCERQPRAIERVGLYIPGGSAPLISTVLMLAVPAQIANNQLRILCTPANGKGEINPYLLVAAELCGIQKIYKIGGAQAIAAMAYGTKTVPKVDKIFGPGNSWVTCAKTLVDQDPQGAAIDMPAGPSELLVIADEDADPDYVAADLLSQAEHGVDSQVILITFSQQFARQIEQALETQSKKLPRANIIKQALTHSRMIITDNVQHAIEISNLYAPEHLILQIGNPEKYISFIQNAGAVFLGNWAPETVGDYVTGSNHVLPTYGYARTHSGLSINDFMKFINFQTVTRNGLEKIGPFAEKLAELEGLQAHKQAVALRLATTVAANE